MNVITMFILLNVDQVFMKEKKTASKTPTLKRLVKILSNNPLNKAFCFLKLKMQRGPPKLFFESLFFTKNCFDCKITEF